MAAQILDGMKIASSIEEDVKRVLSNSDVKPSIVFFVVGDNQATKVYVRKKQEACERVGILSNVVSFNGDVSENELIEKIQEVNSSNTTGIIVQLPLPKHINENLVVSSISTEKDVDCMHPENIGKLLYSSELVPCTVSGIMRLIEETGTNVAGKNVTVINRRHIGKCLSILLLNMKATVSVCGRNSQLELYTKHADIVISAAGSPGLIKRDMIKPGAVVIDVGISMYEGKIRGDVDDNVRDIASFVTPVPGGVGPMTVAMLMKNTSDMAVRNSISHDLYKKHNI
ncbi:MAG TPA: bifunctional 5,10-methylenetetrahydrofolate dehydrogenase/5,10-methenyltetrahydrofolate cyclohydrolase [archaeon]|nr:bifunctional 5,10-methylenetetrahydrofolate dehydrogenase/5,10-methenyltetrahydrofolate cyclohydrolase [archaeon]